ncbi:MAG TPA: AAA family ATPase [Limnochordia bacterium]|nr:AAA family ATPase [Limnochordia bacterium]
MQVIGIAGGSGAGKSTLARALAEALGERVTLIHLDTYFLPGSPTMNRPEAIDPAQVAADLDRLAAGETVVRAARRGGELRYEPRPLVLLEGHLLFCYPELVERLALRIWVEMDDDERVARRLGRVTGGGDDFKRAIDWYLSDAKPGYDRFIGPSKAQADLSVRGDGDPRRLALLLKLIEAL